jgi:hypothetical protein
MGTTRHMPWLNAASALLLAAAACGGGNDDTPDAAPQEPDAQALCAPQNPGTPDPANGDLTGTWAFFTKYRSNVQGFGAPQISRGLNIHEVTQDGEIITVTETLCAINVVTVDGGTKIDLGPGFVTSQPTVTRTGTVVASGNAYDVSLEATYVARGVTLADPASDPLPTDPADPSIGDWDGDGNPGLTLLLDGFVSGQLFVIQRDFAAFAGAQESVDKVEGLATWGTEQVFLGANPEYLLDLVSPAQPDPDPSLHTFQMVRVPAGTDCAYVIEHKCDLFVDVD